MRRVDDRIQDAASENLFLLDILLAGDATEASALQMTLANPEQNSKSLTRSACKCRYRVHRTIMAATDLTGRSPLRPLPQHLRHWVCRPPSDCPKPSSPLLRPGVPCRLLCASETCPRRHSAVPIHTAKLAIGLGCINTTGPSARQAPHTPIKLK